MLFLAHLIVDPFVWMAVHVLPAVGALFCGRRP